MYRILKSSMFRVLVSLIIPFLSFINIFIKKEKGTVLFFDSKQVFLNNYALYNYMIENNYNQKYKIYYSMPTTSKELFDKENVVLFSGLLKTLFVFLRTETCYIDIGTFRVNPAPNQRIINLWHGTPLKRIGHMSKGKTTDLKPKSLSCFSKITISSDRYIDIYKESFNISESQIAFCNQTRNDVIMKPKNDALASIGVVKEDYNKIVMWMTTYRISSDSRLIHGENDWSETNIPLLSDVSKLISFNELLSEQNVLLIIKIHHGSEETSATIPALSNIEFIDELSYINKGVQLYDLLAHCDVLVTDYSSVYFDFLLLNRPIIFVVDDYDQYEKLNGFVFENALEYMPGEKVYNINDLDRVFTNLSQDSYESERVRINKIVNQYNYDSNCDFVLKLGGIDL